MRDGARGMSNIRITLVEQGGETVLEDLQILYNVCNIGTVGVELETAD